MLFWKLFFFKETDKKSGEPCVEGKIGIITVNIYGSVEHKPQGKNSENGALRTRKAGERGCFSRPPGKPGATWLGYASSTDGISVKWLLFCSFFTSILKTNIYAPFLLKTFSLSVTHSPSSSDMISLWAFWTGSWGQLQTAQRRLVMCVCVSMCLCVCISVCVQTSVSVCVYLCVCKHTGRVSHWILRSNFLYNIEVVYIPIFSWGSAGIGIKLDFTLYT